MVRWSGEHQVIVRWLSSELWNLLIKVRWGFSEGQRKDKSFSELDIGGHETCLKKLFLCENLRISFQLKTKLEVWMQSQKKIVRKRTFSRSREDRERRRLRRRTKIKSRGRRILEISFFKNQRPSQEDIAELAADAKLERCVKILRYLSK